jgi:hypothetical protein
VFTTALVGAVGACRTAPTTTPPPSAPPAAPTAAALGPSPALGAIAGRVTAAASGQPLPRARIVVTSPALSGARVTLTGPDGRYRVEELPAGRYTVAVVKSGFVPAIVGDETDQGAFELAPGERRDGVDVALARAGAISGRVLDEDGTPFEGATVEVWRTRLSGGQRILVAVGRATTDDRGEFRVGGLPAGFFLVSASDPAWTGVGSAAGPLTYAPTFYPGVVSPQEAARLAVEPGGETSGVVFTLRIVRPVRVSGRLVAPGERPLLSGAITLSAEGTGRLAGPAPVVASDVVLRPDGQFTFRNVTPGRYVIRARGETERGGTPLFGTFLLTVEGQDLDHVTIPLSPGATAEGRVEFAADRGTPPSATTAVRVRAVAADGVAFADALSDPLGRDGRFVVRGLMPGRYVFRVDGLSEPWWLAEVWLHGRQVVDLPVPVEPGDRLDGLRILVKDAGAVLAGSVRTAAGRPVRGGSVVVFAADRGLWTPYTRHLRVARIQPDGRYRLAALPPGTYWVSATEAVVSADDLDGSALEQLAVTATRVELREGEEQSLDLVVVPAGAVPHAG